MRENKHWLGKNEKFILLIFSVFYVWYSISTMIELPHMTWFDQIPLVDLFYNGELGISDLLSKYGEHGMLANNILWLTNVVIFNGSTLFDVWLNIINVTLTGVIVAELTYRSFEVKRKSDFVWIIAEAIFLFCCMQGSSGAMETQVRLGLLFFFITMMYVNEEIQKEEIFSKRHFGLTILFMILSINVFGTLYSFAGIPLVWLILIFKMIKNKKIVKKYMIMVVTYFFTILLYIIEYSLFDMVGSEGSEGSSLVGNFLHMILHPIATLQCFFSWCANGVLGWAFHESKSFTPNLWLGVGAITFIMIMGAVILFFFCNYSGHPLTENDIGVT